MKSAKATFQRVIDNTISDIAEPTPDDILIAGRTREEHNKSIRECGSYLNREAPSSDVGDLVLQVYRGQRWVVADPAKTEIIFLECRLSRRRESLWPVNTSQH